MKNVKTCAWRTLLVMAIALEAGAQAYPGKPVRVVLTYPAGAGPDLIVRRASQQLAPRLGQPLVVENRPGGNNVIAAEACAKAVPDGYTLCTFNPGMMVYNPVMMASLPYDADRDLRAIVNLFYVISGIYSSTAVNAKTVQELGAFAASRPGGLNFGTLGPGNAIDVVRQWLGERWKVKLQAIPYKGGNLIIAALAANEIDLTWIGLQNVAGQLKAGRIRVFAVDSEKRYRLLPDVPTFQEAGLGAAPARRAWTGIGGPSGIPDAVVSRMHAEFSALLRDAGFSTFLDEQGVEAAGAATPQEYSALIRSDRAAAAELVKRYDMKP
jgi:tripartite-type tricarboxylate transporter receptor subunit TctC